MNDSKIEHSFLNIKNLLSRNELISVNELLDKSFSRFYSISGESSSDKKENEEELRQSIEQTKIDKNATIKQNLLQSQTEALVSACEMDTTQTKEHFKNNLLQLLKNVEFEFGYKTQADDYINNAIDSYDVFVREWVNEMFLENFENPYILSSILRVISHLDYSQIYPQGITMAIAATRHDDIEVRECGIRCFENWESHESIPILKNLSFSEDWLSDYLFSVITDLEEIGVECL